tara:strand:- start:16465 stop:17442 length:978 start_codon:yes stop_codon:yes gene_type:complete
MKNFNYVGWESPHRKVANVFWRINRYCNYSCSYCWPHAHSNKKDFLDENTYLLAIDHIINQFKENGFKTISWGWAGGEVTFNPHFLSILEEIQSYDAKMSTNLVTNLSQSLKWWEVFVKNTSKFVRARVNASWHKEYLREENKRLLFKEKLVFLKHSNINTVVNCVMLPGELEEMKKLIDFFNDCEIPVMVKACRSNNKVIEGYTNKELEFVQKQIKHKNPKVMLTIDDDENEYYYSSAEQLIAGSNLNFLGWRCTAGYQSITINNDGTVTRGTMCRKEVLGNIKTGFKIFNEVKKCITNLNCHCGADLKMPKWRSNEYNMSEVG